MGLFSIPAIKDTAISSLARTYKATVAWFGYGTISSLSTVTTTLDLNN
jgi:hypothetical protein